MRLTPNYFLLSFERAGPERLRQGLFALVSLVGATAFAIGVVLVFAPRNKMPAHSGQFDNALGSVHRVGKVVYGPGPSEPQCRGFQFDNRTAVLEQTGDSECGALVGRRHPDAKQFGGIRENLRH
jgi:hypothetical protein